MKKLVVLVLLVPAFALAIYDMKWFDLNNWRCPFYNDGRWGIDTTQGTGVAGGFWRDTAYIFGAGIWFGALPTGDTLTTVGYNPNTGGSECVPTLNRYCRERYNNPADRIYRFPGDWPPPLSRFPMAPQRRASESDLWGCFGDSDQFQHQSPGRPIGVDVALSAFGFTGSLAEDILFIRYDCFNYNDFVIPDAYVGVVMDPDIGSGSNDLTGLILDRWFHIGPDSFRVRDVGFAYSQDHNPSGAVAVKLMSTPAGLGLSAFKRFSIDYDPTTDWAQYLTMAGYDYLTGEYLPFDSIDPTPADKRFILCTGPFDLLPDSSVTLWYAVIGAPFWHQSDFAVDTTELALRCRAAESLMTVLSGVAEEPPTTRKVQPIATIVRGVLFLPESPIANRGSPSVLLDIGGRKVADLHPGANDVRALAPGVYFVRERHAQAQAQAQAVRKVIVTR